MGNFNLHNDQRQTGMNSDVKTTSWPLITQNELSRVVVTPPSPPASLSLCSCQAAWARMISTDAVISSSFDPSETLDSNDSSNTLTASDLVKGGDTPVLLASDALGRVGLLRYPALLPESPDAPVEEERAPGEGPFARVSGTDYRLMLASRLQVVAWHGLSPPLLRLKSNRSLKFCHQIWCAR